MHTKAKTTAENEFECRNQAHSLPARIMAFGLRLVGKEYKPAPDLPAGLILSVLQIRLNWLVRGILRFRKLVFLGPRVSLRGTRTIQLGRFSTVEAGCSIDGFANLGVVLGERCKLGSHSIISCTSHLSKMGIGIQVGDDCGISEFCYFGASGGIRIGKNVIMGQYVSFHSENHNFQDLEHPIRNQGVSSKGIVVGDNVWIGARVTILDGSVIGNNCVIAAGAVVRGEYPSNCVIGGIPSKILKRLESPSS